MMVDSTVQWIAEHGRVFFRNLTPAESARLASMCEILKLLPSFRDDFLERLRDRLDEVATMDPVPEVQLRVVHFDCDDEYGEEGGQ